MSIDEIKALIQNFIAENFLDGDPDGELEDTTPLLESGVLNSMNSAILLNFLREEIHVRVPLTEMNEANFRDVQAISKLVAGMVPAPAGAEGAQKP
ncbi:acyl carrier protein [Actinomadura mexicana]|uniref:Clorobiocin biosynthesis protein CloN5 n=1 Tax=Actinomadura mexicana TaxID=134959 RepID=A0A238XMB6_9ACTN|nr:phosphopantetheine-binding protein [Actinomadura mexicana]SNR59711.1 clorobiocin biosynthesis protein CloN5 [Actinomadura mexicana]